MRSKTSYFNPTLFWKNVTRFWPLWGLYTLVWLVALPLRGLNELRQCDWARYDFQSEVLGWGRLGVWLAAVFAILFAMALFGYLYQSRSACMIHALPIRREGLFLTNYLSGVVFFVLPNTLVALATIPVQMMSRTGGLWCVAAWWVMVTGAFLFFFSFAVFCAMFTGHILALPAFYGILNVLVYTLSALVGGILNSSLYGFQDFSSDAAVRAFTPVWGLAVATGWHDIDQRPAMESPVAFALYVLAGLVFAVLALLVYRRRQVETAGDVVAVAWVRPVFRYGVALCSGLCVGMLVWMVVGLSGSVSLWLSILLWAVIGYFGAEMLLQKSFRVFRGRWKGALAVAAVVLLCWAGVELDLFGYESHVPAADQVTSVEISGLESAPYDSGNWVSAEFSDPEIVAEIVALHQAVVDNREDCGHVESSYFNLRLDYTLAGGGHMLRRYSFYACPQELDTPGTTAYLLDLLLNDPEMISAAYGLEDISDYTGYCVNMTETGGGYGEVTVVDDPVQAQQVWEAVQADFAEGNLGRRYPFETQERLDQCYWNDLILYLSRLETDENGAVSSSDRDLSVTLTPNARHTLAVLKELGALDKVTLMTVRQVQDDGELAANTTEVFYDDRVVLEAAE